MPSLRRRFCIPAENCFFGEYSADRVDWDTGMPTVAKNADGSLTIAMGNTPIRRIDIRDIDKVTFFRNATENGITTIEINFAGDGSFFNQI
jgi:hypothetical protein